VSSAVLYICIPVHNEAPTVGLVLWKIRKVFQEYSREYEIIAYDDGSTDATNDALQAYTKILPLTIIGSPTRLGYPAALDALCRTVSARTRYPRRDAMIVMQGDFTDQPEHLPELVKRFEGGADIVVAERTPDSKAPVPVRRLRWAASWILRPFISVPGVSDPFGTLRLFRISIIRDLIKALGDTPLAESKGWAANAEILMRTVPLARKVETVALAQRFDLRPRESRIQPWADAVALFKFGRGARARVAVQARTV
jgi:glycosyltransferase involved in cell wall biosynthesis